MTALGYARHIFKVYWHSTAGGCAAKYSAARLEELYPEPTIFPPEWRGVHLALAAYFDGAFSGRRKNYADDR